jgi:L-alanine-DL-glutamate epimerase-like enolase superfamily enzyme
LRKTVGEEIGLLHDVRAGHPEPAIVLANAVEDYNLFFFEDPLRPRISTRSVSSASSVQLPIAMGEIFVGQWEAF